MPLVGSRLTRAFIVVVMAVVAGQWGANYSAAPALTTAPIQAKLRWCRLVSPSAAMRSTEPCRYQSPSTMRCQVAGSDAKTWIAGRWVWPRTEESRVGNEGGRTG